MVTCFKLTGKQASERNYCELEHLVLHTIWQKVTTTFIMSKVNISQLVNPFVNWSYFAIQV